MSLRLPAIFGDDIKDDSLSFISLVEPIGEHLCLVFFKDERLPVPVKASSQYVNGIIDDFIRSR